MMISVCTNPTAIFILIGARTTEQSQVKHELLLCARVLLGNIRRIFYLKISDTGMPTSSVTVQGLSKEYPLNGSRDNCQPGGIYFH